MDFSGIQQTDTKLGVPADKTSNVRVSNPGADALAREQAKTGAIIQSGLDRLRAEVQTGRAMQANNEYNKELEDLTNELRQNKEQDALNTVDQFDEREQKIRSRIHKKYGSFLYGEAGRRYNEMMTRDYNTRRQAMINYQIGEAEKFNDTTLKNGLMDMTNLATDGYTDPESVEGAMEKAAHLVAMRYEHYGAEKIKQMTRVAQGQMAQQVIDRAYAVGDNDAAETYIEKYGRYMDPRVLTGYAKNVYQSRLANLQDMNARSLYAQFGDNIQAAYDHIFGENFSGNGNSDSAIAWFKEQSDKGANWGVNTCTKGVNAALMAGGYKPINTWAPTAWEEQKAAGRTFTDKSKLRNGDIVYWDSAGDGDASHVGIYDAKSGKVYQSGTSGFQAISLGAYKLIGFSHPQGQVATPEEKKRLWAAYQQEMSLRKGFEAQAVKQATEDAEGEFFRMYRDGITDPALYRAKATELAGNDPKLFRSLITKSSNYASVAGKASGSKGNGKVDPLFEHSVVSMMTAGGYSNADILEYINNPENGVSDTDKVKALKLIEQRNRGEGPFKFDWNAIKSEVMQGYKEKNKEYVWSNVKAKLVYEIDKYRKLNGGKDPEMDYVAKVGAAALVDNKTYQVPGTWFGTNRKKVNDATLASVGIMDMYENSNGLMDIILRDGRQRRITGSQLNRILKGEPLEQVIREE